MEDNKEKGKLEIKGYDASFKFAKSIFEKYPKVIKTLVLFGSYSKGSENEKSDVDIMVVLDDVLNVLDEKLLAAFYADVDIEVKKSPVKLHINFVTLTAFWRGVMAADPVTVNVLKYGVPLIDTGYFEPLQALLNKGEIKPTEESIYASLSRSEIYYGSANLKLPGAVIDAYWSIINSAQAFLMKQGEVPPSPEFLSGMLEKESGKKTISRAEVDIFNGIYEIGRKLLHGDRVEIKGAEVDNILTQAKNFNAKMVALISPPK